MSNLFYISDLHYDHANILNFKRDDGTPLRPFATLDEMQATISHNWNKVVGDKDTVYVLGDVVMNKNAKSLEFLKVLRGRKILIKGNHDLAPINRYSNYFEDIRAYDRKECAGQRIIASHIPIHPDSLARFGVNVHGHLHSGEVLGHGDDEFVTPDARYFNVSCERIDYTPIAIEELVKRIKER
jgi:calcineurin-like phosphoesterase family protein